MEVGVIANLLLCTVRSARDVDRRFCFEVVSPNETFVFQGENEEDFSDWFHVCSFPFLIFYFIKRFIYL